MTPLVLLVAMVYVCELPGGHIRTVTFHGDDASRQREVIARLERDGTLPAPTTCWMMSANELPRREDRHRWRRGVGNTVVVP